MKLIWWFLAISAAYGFGYHYGKRVQVRASKAQADAIHKSIGMFCDESAKLRTVIEKARAVQAAVPSDTVATEPLRFKPGEVDSALRAGKLALGRDHGGRDN